MVHAYVTYYLPKKKREAEGGRGRGRGGDYDQEENPDNIDGINAMS